MDKIEERVNGFVKTYVIFLGDEWWWAKRLTDLIRSVLEDDKKEQEAECRAHDKALNKLWQDVEQMRKEQEARDRRIFDAGMIHGLLEDGGKANEGFAKFLSSEKARRNA